MILFLLNPHAIRLAPAKSFRVIHLFRFGRRDDELPRRGRAREVRIFVHALPQQRSESLDAIVAQVLMFEPFRSQPPPTVSKRPAAVLRHTGLLFIARDSS